MKTAASAALIVCLTDILLTSLNEVNRKAGYKIQFSDNDRDETWLPIDRYIDKPVKARDLASEIRKLLNKPFEKQPSFGGR